VGPTEDRYKLQEARHLLRRCRDNPRRPQALTIEDRRFAEQRFVTVGLDALGRLLVIVYTYSSSADVVRLISARGATARERRQYDGKKG
jgi:uncharacterized DUF497 family protein